MTAIPTFAAALGVEVNTFAALPTGMANVRSLLFQPGGSLPRDRDPPLIAAPLKRARRLAELGVIDLREGLCAGAQPGGVLARSAYEFLRDMLLRDLENAGRVALVLLGLHGATVAEGYDDCEGDLLGRVRAAVGPDAIIAALLDPHAHLTRGMIETADLLYAYKEYPHDDIFPVAEKLVDDAVRCVRGEIRPVARVFDCRMIGTYNTYRQPMRAFVDSIAAATEQTDALLDISVAHGFPWGDVEDAGTKVWVTTNGDTDLAGSTADAWGRRLVAIREAAQTQLTSISDALECVRRSDTTVVLAETADNPGGGATSDATHLVRGLLEAGIGPLAAGLFWDPVAVDICEAAGEGAHVSLRIGGKASRLSGEPLDLDVRVCRIVEDLQQPFGGGMWPTGKAVMVQSGRLSMVLTRLRTQCFAMEAFTELGVDLAAQKAVIVKSSNHFEASFRNLGGAILRVDTPGALTHAFAELPYQKLKRPIQPLDTLGVEPRRLDWRKRA